MFRSGQFVADHITPVTDEQIQPNGVDLTLEAVFEQREPGHIGTGDKTVGDRQELAGEPVIEVPPDDPAPNDSYSLPTGGYIVRYAEIVSIPEGHVGFIYPRSSLMRNSCMLNTAVWDAGYEGKGEGLLQVHHDIEIEDGARIAQLVLAEADHEGLYEGTYQGENID